MKKLCLFFISMFFLNPSLYAAFLANDYLVVSNQYISTQNSVSKKGKVQLRVLYPKFAGKDPLISERINAILEGYVHTINVDDSDPESLHPIQGKANKMEILVDNAITNIGSGKYFSIKFCQVRNYQPQGSEEECEVKKSRCLKSMTITFNKNTGAMLDEKSVVGAKSYKELDSIINQIISNSSDVPALSAKDEFNLYSEKGEWFVVINRENRVDEVKIPNQYVKIVN